MASGFKKGLFLGTLLSGAVLALSKTRRGKAWVKNAQNTVTNWRDEQKQIVESLYDSLKQELAGVNNVSRKSFETVASSVIAAYAKEKKLTKKAAANLQQALKKEWKKFKQEVKKR